MNMSSRYGALAALMAISACATLPAQAQPDAPAAAMNYRASPFFVFDSAEGMSANAELADVDGDGDLDVLLANGRHWAQQDFVYFNAGNGRLLNALPLGEMLGASYLIRSGDLDADGDIDAVVIRDQLPAQAFLNDGTGHFEFAGDLVGTGGDARHAVLADVNGDGALDVVIVRRRGTNILLLGDGTGAFGPVTDLPGPQDGATGVAAADIDADGDTDLAIARRDGNESLILLNDGWGRFSSHPVEGSLGDHRQVLLEDFTGDARIDLLLCAIEGDSPLFAGDGTGRFKRAGTLGSVDRVIQAVAAADLDGDGDMDIAEGASELSNRVYFNNGFGVFVALTLEDAAEDTYGVAIGDMNGDGLPDLVFANSGAPNIVMMARPPK